MDIQVQDVLSDSKLFTLDKPMIEEFQQSWLLYGLGEEDCRGVIWPV
mgnify:CR=1 FL=1